MKTLHLAFALLALVIVVPLTTAAQASDDCIAIKECFERTPPNRPGTVRPVVGHPLTRAVGHLKANRFSEALDAAQAAQNVPKKTAFETRLTNQIHTDIKDRVTALCQVGRASLPLCWELLEPTPTQQ